jgi:flagellar hook protein FlgE
MDVIGNNIANVNTTAYKAQSVTFNELMYQTTKRASGASAETGVGGTNAFQIGLGVKVGAINTNIATQGAMQTTNLPFDLAITGSAFFIVNNGFENFFTRAGSFYIDGAGNLAMTSTGYNVMGWQVDPDNPNNIRKDSVSALRVMTEANMTFPPEATTLATVSGIVDKNDTDINSSIGKIMNLEFFDNLGYRYTARLATHVIDADSGQFYTQLVDILDMNGVSIGPDRLEQVTFGSNEDVLSSISYLPRTNTNRQQYINVNDGVGGNVISGPVGVTTTVGAAPNVPSAAIQALYGVALVDGDTFTINQAGNLVVPAGSSAPGIYVPVAAASARVDIYFVEHQTLGNDIHFAVGTAPRPLANIPAQNFYRLNASSGDFEFVPGTDPVPPLGPPTFDSVITADNIEALYGIPLDGVLEFIVEGNGTLTVIRREVENVALLDFIPGTGAFARISGNPDGNIILGFGASDLMSNFTDIELNFSNVLMTNNNGMATIGASAGGTGVNRGLGTGRRIGEMIEVIVQDDGRIYANYDNGQSRLLGQISTATFANPSGLEKRGDNLYSATMNSGEFDGIGEDIKIGGGYMSSGVLEMSNVDLSAEFTEMITTQRGFQANSRIITVSDTLLEELTNLKR